MYGLYNNNCPTKKHTNPYFVKQAFTTKVLVFYSTDNLLIIINIRRNRLKSLLNPKESPTRGHGVFYIQLRPDKSSKCRTLPENTQLQALLRSNRSYKKDHTTSITE